MALDTPEVEKDKSLMQNNFSLDIFQIYDI